MGHLLIKKQRTDLVMCKGAFDEHAKWNETQAPFTTVEEVSRRG